MPTCSIRSRETYFHISAQQFTEAGVNFRLMQSAFWSYDKRLNKNQQRGGRKRSRREDEEETEREVGVR